tara:strand:+ start:839 stop:1096 length:258 start_codon:yes stop_codon:yes gene_type:complete
MTRQINLEEKFSNYKSGNTGQCHICKYSHKNKSLFHRHHITYFPENIITVCETCHWNIHHAWIKYDLIKFTPPKGDAKKFYGGEE